MIHTTLGALAVFAVLATGAVAQSSPEVQKRQDCMHKAKQAGLSGKHGAGAILANQREEFMKKCMAEK